MILVTTAVIDTRQDTKFTLWTAGSDQVRSLVFDLLKAGILCILAVCMCKKFYIQLRFQQYAAKCLPEKGFLKEEV